MHPKLAQYAPILAPGFRTREAHEKRVNGNAMICQDAARMLLWLTPWQSR
jgi:hypothetical protein